MNTIQLKCDYCGLRNATVELRIDPYLDEIFHEIIEKYLCDDCYNACCDEI